MRAGKSSIKVEEAGYDGLWLSVMGATRGAGCGGV